MPNAKQIDTILMVADSLVEDTVINLSGILCESDSSLEHCAYDWMTHHYEDMQVKIAALSTLLHDAFPDENG